MKIHIQYVDRLIFTLFLHNFQKVMTEKEKEATPALMTDCRELPPGNSFSLLQANLNCIEGLFERYT